MPLEGVGQKVAVTLLLLGLLWAQRCIVVVDGQIYSGISQLKTRTKGTNGR